MKPRRLERSRKGTRERRCYEVRPRKDKRGVDLISDALPFGRLWYGEPDTISNVVGHAKFFQPFTHDAMIRVYGEAGNVIETHEHKGEFKGGCIHVCARKRGRQK